MRKTILSLTLAATALGAAAAHAQTAPADPAVRGGTMTRAAAIAQADARFAQMDTDNDGVVSRTEMQAYRTAMRDRRIARGDDVPVPPPGGRKHDGMGRKIDPDGNGSVTKAEFEARAGARFDRMDANHDGVIDATERANRAEMRHVDRRERRQGVTPGATVPAPTPAPAQ